MQFRRPSDSGVIWKGWNSARAEYKPWGLEAVSENEPSVRIAALVQGLLAKHDIHTQVDPDADLREAGLTSLDMVNLTLAVEGEFDVFIPADKMTPEHFRSISSIEALVGALEPA